MLFKIFWKGICQTLVLKYVIVPFSSCASNVKIRLCDCICDFCNPINGCFIFRQRCFDFKLIGVQFVLRFADVLQARVWTRLSWCNHGISMKNVNIRYPKRYRTDVKKFFYSFYGDWRMFGEWAQTILNQRFHHVVEWIFCYFRFIKPFMSRVGSK